MEGQQSHLQVEGEEEEEVGLQQAHHLRAGEGEEVVQEALFPLQKQEGV